MPYNRNFRNNNFRRKKKTINFIKLQVMVIIITLITIAVMIMNFKSKKNKNMETMNNKTIENQKKINKNSADDIDEYEEETKDTDMEDNEYEEDIENTKEKDESNKETDEYLNKKWCVLSSFTTKLDTKALQEKNRVHNIKTAAKYLDGLTIPSNSVFSFHRNIWDSGKKKQYFNARIFSNKKTDVGLGGGICQVSTTIFNSILKVPNIDITKRQSHTIKVEYAPVGLDSSYVTGVKDLVFKNKRKYPIMLEVKVKDYGVTVNILGKKEQSDKDYSIEIYPAKKIEEKKGEVTYNVLVKTKYEDKTIKTQNFKSTYKKEN